MKRESRSRNVLIKKQNGILNKNMGQWIMYRSILVILMSNCYELQENKQLICITITVLGIIYHPVFYLQNTVFWGLDSVRLQVIPT